MQSCHEQKQNVTMAINISLNSLVIPHDLWFVRGQIGSYT